MRYGKRKSQETCKLQTSGKEKGGVNSRTQSDRTRQTTHQSAVSDSNRKSKRGKLKKGNDCRFERKAGARRGVRPKGRKGQRRGEGERMAWPERKYKKVHTGNKGGVVVWMAVERNSWGNNATGSNESSNRYTILHNENGNGRHAKKNCITG